MRRTTGCPHGPLLASAALNGTRSSDVDVGTLGAEGQRPTSPGGVSPSTPQGVRRGDPAATARWLLTATSNRSVNEDESEAAGGAPQRAVWIPGVRAGDRADVELDLGAEAVDGGLVAHEPGEGGGVGACSSTY